MVTHTTPHRRRITINVAPELQQQVKLAAASHDISLSEYVVAALKQALTQEQVTEPKPAPENEESTAWEDPFAEIWAKYDPERALAALKSSAGALAGIDHEAFLRDIYAERGQGEDDEETSE